MGASLSVHLLLCWGDAVLRAERVSPTRRFVLGDGGDWVLPAEALGAPRLELLTVEDGQTVLSLGTAGACVVREGMRCRVELGAFTIDVDVHGAEPSPWTRSRIPLGPAAHHLGSAALHCGLLAAIGSYPSPSAEDLDATDARDRAAFLTGMLGRSDAFTLDSRGPHDEGDSAATGSRDDPRTAGAAGEPALTEEGSMGNPVTRATHGHVAVQGPHDAKDPRLAREAIIEALSFPAIYLRTPVPAPDPDAPLATWGRVLSEGTDTASARGPMFGGTIEDALGPGGLGLSGTGEGGGYHAVAIGLGALGLGEGLGTGSSGLSGVGHGFGACGCGEGVSGGHGRLGGGHAVGAPRIRVGATSVNGRLPPEVIQRVIRSNMGRFRYCYEQSLRPQPSLQGRVTTRFAIARDGSVPFAVDAGSDVPDAALIACVDRAFESLSFPRPEGGVVTVVYPLILAPGE